MKQGNLFVENCPSKSVKICFDAHNQECDIDVDVGRKEVKKNGESMFFETDALMYAAIFSEKNIYENQIKRLMKRTNELLLLYDDKAVILSDQGCEIDVNLLTFKNVINGVQNSGDLAKAANMAESIEIENDYAECELW